ncbi:MAG: alpha/beta hydrolase family protein [Acidobacteria bacterium]|nr:alpha/beta hydrolase family protein [Acidobacteriota bacterium]
MERREERFAARTTDRVVREFDWGLEWSRNWPLAAPADCDTLSYLIRMNEMATSESATFYDYKTPSDFHCEGNRLRFTSFVTTPFSENNAVQGLWFPASKPKGRAVIVLPHWNAQLQQHISLCRLLQVAGISALRLSLPYHDLRMPGELNRADYAVSSNVARTIDATRQAVIDTRSALDWFQSMGYDRLGIVGTSLGSCYAFLTSAHDARLRVNVFNLFSYYFADVVWTGLTTRHIRQGFDGQIDLEQLRKCWKVIAPASYMDRFAGNGGRSLFIYGSCDTTFLPQFSKQMIREIRRRHIAHKVVVLPCGHYTLGESPFKFIDAYHICSFLLKLL